MGGVKFYDNIYLGFFPKLFEITAETPKLYYSRCDKGEISTDENRIKKQQTLKPPKINIF